MEIDIKKATPDDYQLLTELWERAHLPYKPHGRDSFDHIKKEMEHHPQEVFLLAYCDQQAVATVLVTHDGRKGWVNRLAVVPEYQHMGIGRKMVVAAESWLKEQGIGIFACMIESYNEASFKAFQKMGYEPFEGIHYLTKRLHPGI